MSNADRVGLAFFEETTWGELPGSAPTLQDLRFVSESLAQETGTTRSPEIRDDRQTSHVHRTSVNASGDINFELSFDGFDAFLSAALGSADFTPDDSVTSDDTDVVFVAATSQINSMGAFPSVPAVGSWIKVSGAAEDANNGFFRVTSSSSTSIEVHVPAGTLVDETPGASVTILEGGQAVNGVAHRSFGIERTYEDLVSADRFVYYLGMMVDTLSLSIASESIISGVLGFRGKTENDGGGSTIGDGSNIAAPSNIVMNTVDHVAQIREGESGIGVLSFDINTANNLRLRPEVASLGPISLGKGKFTASGTLQAYFTTKALLDKYLNFTTTSLELAVTDIAGNSYVFEMPSVKFTQGRRVTGGENTDIIADLQWEAFMDSSLGYTMKIAKFAA